ncbi:MAG: hypothetical protein HWD83_07445, partial [Gammaproteobacteria bacterium]|nr:hypothetical protein [Gammaproteobacteria bacterium]
MVAHINLWIVISIALLTGCTTLTLDGEKKPLADGQGALFVRVSDAAGYQPINRISIVSTSAEQPKQYTIFASRAYRGSSHFFSARLPQGSYRIEHFQHVYQQGDLIITRTFAPDDDTYMFKKFTVEANKATTLGTIHSFPFYDAEAEDTRHLFIHTPPSDGELHVDGLYPGLDLASIEEITREQQTNESLTSLVAQLPKQFYNPTTDSSGTTYTGLVLGGVLAISQDAEAEIYHLDTEFPITNIATSPSGAVAVADEFGHIYIRQSHATDWIEYQHTPNASTSEFSFADSDDLRFFASDNRGIQYIALSAESNYAEPTVLFEHNIRNLLLWNGLASLAKFLAIEVRMYEWEEQTRLSIDLFKKWPNNDIQFVAPRTEHFIFDLENQHIEKDLQFGGIPFDELYNGDVAIGYNRFVAPAFDSGYEVYLPELDEWEELEDLRFSACRDFDDDDDICRSQRRLEPLEIARRTERVVLTGRPVFRNSREGVVVATIRHTSEQARTLMERDSSEDLGD